MQFITKDDIYERLGRYRLPAGAAYYLRRYPGRLYSQVGIICEERKFPIFDVYTGHQELYVKIRDMIHEVADELSGMFIFDEWSNDESRPSGQVITEPSSEGLAGGTIIGAGTTGECPSIIGEPQGRGVFFVS